MAEEDTQAPEGLTPDEHARNRGVVEALLIASDEPVLAGALTSALAGVGLRQVRGYIDDLNQEYQATGRSFRIAEVAGGFELMVLSEYAPWVRQLLREKAPARLSQAALETLAIVAFKQPIAKAEVENIRGVDVDGVVRHLLEKGLIRIAGRGEGVGRPLLYGTTRDFLKHFGLKTLSDLPKLREIEELFREEGQQPPQGVLDRVVRADGQEGEQGARPDATAGDGGTTPGTPEPVLGEGGDRLPEGLRPADPERGSTG